MRFSTFFFLASGALAVPAPEFPVAVLFSDNNYKGEVQTISPDECTKLNENLRWEVNSVLLAKEAYCLTYYTEDCDAKDVAAEYQESVDTTDPDVVVAVSCHH